MDPERWRAIEQIFHAALERRQDERAKFLDSACAGDPELRGEVESLLIETSQTAVFMQPLFAKFGETDLSNTATASLTGRELNHYRISALLGAGALGQTIRA